MYVSMYLNADEPCVCVCLCIGTMFSECCYGVAMISRLLKITGLFCRAESLL